MVSRGMVNKIKAIITLEDGTELSGEGFVDDFVMSQDREEVTEFGSPFREFIAGRVTYKVNATFDSLSSEGKDADGNSSLRETVEKLTRKMDRNDN